MPVDASETGEPLVGRIIADRYRVLGPLGKGGMGAVYRAEHLMLKKELALKFLHPELGRFDDVLRRFEREAEAAARLDHPNIVGVTDFGRTADGMLFLAMELLNGQSLTELIRSAAPLPLERALPIARQILRALDHAHAAGVVHRDLKPDNVMLISRDGEADVVKLLDFGIAKMTGSDGDAAEALTQAGVVFGTPEYLSPEQAMGEEADARADLYSAGVVLYEASSGRRPFTAPSKLAVVSMHLTQEALPVSAAAPAAAIPRWLEQVVQRAMAKPREQRFASAQAMLQALDGPGAAASVSLPSPRRRAASPLGRGLQALGARLAGGWSWLVQRAARAGVPWPRAFALLALTLPAALLGLLVMHARPAAAPAAPLHTAALERLRSGRGCRERRAAALELIATGDPRYLDSLRAARERRGGFLGLEELNGCMRRELDSAIHSWEAQK